MQVIAKSRAKTTTKVTVGNYFGEHEIANLKKVVLTSFLMVAGIMAVIAIGGVFYWNALSSFFNQNPAMVQYSNATFWWMMFPCVLYGLGQALQSTFYGTGRTKNIPFISGICNFGLIIPFWILARMGYLAASFDNVMALFVVDVGPDEGLVLTWEVSNIDPLQVVGKLGSVVVQIHLAR
jgi:Na+-driven multidrug efflux pump